MTPDPCVCPLSLTAAANVRWLLGVSGWNLSRLAKETGMAPAMISHLVAGKRNFTLPTLERVAAALGVAPGDLLAPVPEPRENATQDEHVEAG
jgi:transcriptional regulator with XRE-family HTH domain